MNTMPSATLLETDLRLAMTGDHDAYARIVERSANVVFAIALAIVSGEKAAVGGSDGSRWSLALLGPPATLRNASGVLWL